MTLNTNIVFQPTNCGLLSDHFLVAKTEIIDLDQWFLTFYARWTPKIIFGLHGPLNHQTFKEMLFKVLHFYDFHGPLDPLDPLHGPLRGPRPPGQEPID